MEIKNIVNSDDKNLCSYAPEYTNEEIRKLALLLFRPKSDSCIELSIRGKGKRVASFIIPDILYVYSIKKKYSIKTEGSDHDSAINQNLTEVFESIKKEKMDHCFYKGKSCVINLNIIEQLMVSGRKSQTFVKNHLKRHYPELKGINISELFKAFESYRLWKMETIKDVNKYSLR